MKKRTLCMCFAVVLLLTACERNPNHDVFYLDIWDGFGRVLCSECPEYYRMPTGYPADSLKRYLCEFDNWGDEGFPQEEEVNEFYDCVYTYHYHQTSGVTDTLYGWKRVFMLHYVHRQCVLDKWMIVENKRPGKILGHRYLQNPENKKKNPRKLKLEDYTYEGQEKLFDSDLSDFWIVSLKTPDLYGPFTEQQVVTQMKKLQIPLPVTLKSRGDWYVHSRNKDRHLLPIPKKYLWAGCREDKVLGK